VQEHESLSWAPQPFAVLEMSVVRLATLATGEDVAALLARLDELERRLGGGAPSGDGGGAPAPARGRPTPPVPRPRDPRADSIASPPVARAASEAPPSQPAARDVLLDRLRAATAERDRALAAALDGARLLEDSEGRLRIEVAQAFAANRLERRQAELEAIGSRLLGRPVRIAIAGPKVDAGRRGEPSDAEEALRRRRRDALAHPAVNAALEILGGEVVEIRTLGDERP
jgi:DNA polymerase-3 subunit gamma/tau